MISIQVYVEKNGQPESLFERDFLKSVHERMPRGSQVEFKPGRAILLCEEVEDYALIRQAASELPGVVRVYWET